MSERYVLVVAEEDPVATAVAEAWGTPTAARHLTGVGVIRELPGSIGLLRRPGLHIHDDGLVVPGAAPGDARPTLVFPSVHRSASETPALTVHPLGNPTGAAEVGGRPHTLVPTDPRLMADALRRVSEVGGAIGWRASYEATHHGPALDQPAFFVEIGAVDWRSPPPEAVAAYARLLLELEADPKDALALGLGGGHYAPHFSDLVRTRHWAVGHLLPRYARAECTREVMAAAVAGTPGLSGGLYQRAEDVEEWAPLGAPPRVRETSAPRRDAPGPPTPRPPDAARSAGT